MNFQTIEERAKELLETWKGRTIMDGEMTGDMATMMRALVADCVSIANQYWSPGEIDRGCDLCKVAQCISEEIAATFRPEGRAEGLCMARRGLVIKGKSP